MDYEVAAGASGVTTAAMGAYALTGSHLVLVGFGIVLIFAIAIRRGFRPNKSAVEA